MELVFIVAGEYPQLNSLIRSQVLNVINFAIDNEIKNKLVVFIPIYNFISDKLKNKKELSEFKQYCKDSNIELHIFLYSFFGLGSYSTHKFKNFFNYFAVKKLNKLIKGKNAVMHCRSYFATDIAIKSNIKKAVIFDTRSILTKELFFTMNKRKWKKIIGKALLWEQDLINMADEVIVQGKGVEKYFKDLIINEKKVHCIPIIGFDYNPYNEDTFRQRWAKKEIVYIGGIGSWNTENALLAIIKEIEQCNFNFKLFTNRKRIGDYDCTLIKYDELVKLYDSFLGSIIPGKLNNELTSNDKLQFSINFFSTKAIEAITKGIPIIVNEAIKELRDLVYTYDCGILYKVLDSKIVFTNCTINDLKEFSFWKTKTKNMFLLGELYSKEKALESYREIWKKYV